MILLYQLSYRNCMVLASSKNMLMLLNVAFYAKELGCCFNCICHRFWSRAWTTIMVQLTQPVLDCLNLMSLSPMEFTFRCPFNGIRTGICG